MEKIRRILVATDLSERSLFAARRAAILYNTCGGEAIELLTVKEPGLPDALAATMHCSVDAATAMIVEQVRRELQLVAREMEDNYGVRPALEVRFGYPEKEVIRRAQEFSSDITVIGSHGGNFLSDLVLGNTADRLVRLSKGPLLIVKRDPLRAYEQILVPVDFSADSEAAARLALRIASDAQVALLHAFDIISDPREKFSSVFHARSGNERNERIEAEEKARELVDRFVSALAPQAQKISRKVVFGLPGPAVREEAKKTQPDVIVVGKHGRSLTEELLLGNVTRTAINHTASDVLVASLPVS